MPAPLNIDDSGVQFDNQAPLGESVKSPIIGPIVAKPTSTGFVIAYEVAAGKRRMHVVLSELEGGFGESGPEITIEEVFEEVFEEVN